MSILIDYNQTFISNMMAQLGSHTNSKIELPLVRHMVLNSLRSYKQKFSREYGQMIICADHALSWRKDVFPYYKANRKKDRDKSDIDWKAVFVCLETVRNEIRDNFPYRVILVERCEADDIIGTIALTSDEALLGPAPILIMSGDTDFMQLHALKHIKQYDPVRKKWIATPDPVKYLKEHILEGDRADGIPNVLSEDNCFAVGTRQKPLRATTKEKIISEWNSAVEPTLAARIARNMTLIDLHYTPKDLQKQIIDQYEAQSNKDSKKLLQYFASNKLQELMGAMSEF